MFANVNNRLGCWIAAAALLSAGCGERGDDARAPGPDAPGPAVAWSATLQDQARAGAAVADGRVIVADAAGAVYAFDAATGELLWRSEATGAAVSAGAALADGAAIVTDLAGRVRAIELADGSPRWTADTGAPIHGAVQISGGAAVAANEAGVVLRLALADGAEIERVELPIQTFGQPGADENGILVAACDAGGLYRLTPATGPERVVQPGDPVRPAPLVVDDSVVLAETSGAVQRWRLSDGSAMWAQPVRAGDGMLLSAPVRRDDQVILGGADNAMYAFALDDGRRLWRFAGRGAFDDPAAVAGDVVFAGCDDGRLYALNAADGALRWRIGFASALVGAPIVEQATVFVVEADGAVHAVTRP